MMRIMLVVLFKEQFICLYVHRSPSYYCYTDSFEIIDKLFTLEVILTMKDVPAFQQSFAIVSL